MMPSSVRFICPCCSFCSDAFGRRIRTRFAPGLRHYGVVGQAGKLKGKTTRPGLWKNYACRKPFTVRMGSVFESSHVPLRCWLQIMFLMCASKKGISTRQIQRMLGCSLKTAWFLGHRIREAMKETRQFFDAGRTLADG